MLKKTRSPNTSARRLIGIRLAALGCVALGGMGQGVVAPKLPELLASSERLSFDSGVGAALMYLGIFVSTRAYGRLADRGRAWSTLGLGLLAYAVTLGALALSGSLAAVFWARLAEGLSLSAVYVAADYLIARLSASGERGRWLSYYGVALSIGLLLGPTLALSWPYIIHFHDYGQPAGWPVAKALVHLRGAAPTTSARAPIWVVAGLAAVAGLAVLLGPCPHESRAPSRGELRGKIRFARPALLVAAAYGYMESGLISVFPVLAATQLGLKPEICLLAAILSAAATSVFWGVLSDRRGPRGVALGLLAGLMLGPVALLGAGGWFTIGAQALAACSLFGVLAGGLYPVGFSWLLKGVPEAAYGAASGAFARAYGLGSLTGPLLVGLSAQGLGFHGLLWAMAAAGGAALALCASSR